MNDETKTPIAFLCIDSKADLVIIRENPNSPYAPYSTILNTSINKRKFFKNTLLLAGYIVLEEWQE